MSKAVINYYRIGKRLFLRYPEIAQNMLCDEFVQHDITGQLPNLYQKFLELNTISQGEASMKRLKFVAIIVKHADPEVFTTAKKLKPGIRSELAEFFKCDGSAISHTLKNIKTYMEIYKEFRNEIEDLYIEMFEPFKHESCLF